MPQSKEIKRKASCTNVYIVYECLSIGSFLNDNAVFKIHVAYGGQNTWEILMIFAYLSCHKYDAVYIKNLGEYHNNYFPLPIQLK